MSEPRDIIGPFIRWTNYGYEGWSPSSFPTLREAIDAESYGSEYVITKTVDYQVVEVEGTKSP